MAARQDGIGIDAASRAALRASRAFLRMAHQEARKADEHCSAMHKTAAERQKNKKSAKSDNSEKLEFVRFRFIFLMFWPVFCWFLMVR